MSKQKRVIRVPNPVVSRTVVFNDKGCDQLRTVRDHFESQLSEEMGEPVSLPFPTVISIVLDHYVNLRGLYVSRKNVVDEKINPVDPDDTADS